MNELEYTTVKDIQQNGNVSKKHLQRSVRRWGEVGESVVSGYGEG